MPYIFPYSLINSKKIIKNENNFVFITGSTDGIGFELAK